MDINMSLIGQMITFAVLVWFTMKFVFPPLTKMLDERTQRIADGLAAADKGRAEMAAAEKLVQAELSTARNESQKRIIEDAKKTASEEAARIIAAAKAEADQQASRARDALRGEVATLAVKGAEQILKREVNASAHADLLNQLKAEL